ncbi:DUF6339 family protein [Salinispira pacifica]|uniref:Uncharacterized protein n=1 Tax=Salinispira pacifica TaxID=1307761 RepID=V5WG07_9SPIO|nr:DUF6339 family protein [Salinispira pacifica]AHC14091.1 hypothetical protein L21SP2_0662 [Salinispira pacifica]
MIYQDYLYSYEKFSQEYIKVFSGENSRYKYPSQLTEVLSNLKINVESVEYRKNQKWQYDCIIAEKLYCGLKDLSIAIASDRQFWWRINVEVLSEIIKERWQVTPENYLDASKKNRVQHQTRNYGGSLWWFFALCHSPGKSTNDTLSIMSEFSTDTLVAVVERSGDGYHKSLIQLILNRILHSGSNYDGREEMVRKVMKLNSAWQETIIPDLYKGGLNHYVDDLLKELRFT